MISDIKSLKRKVDSISDNIKIYEADLSKHIQNLKSRGIDGSMGGISAIGDYIKELKEENKKLIDKEQSLLGKANRILNRMEE